MKTILYMLCTALLLSCNTEQNRLDTAKENIKQYVEDVAFKNNSYVEWYEFKVLSIDQALRDIRKVEYLSNLNYKTELYTEMMKLEGDLIKNYGESLNRFNANEMMNKMEIAKKRGDEYEAIARRYSQEAKKVGNAIDTIVMGNLFKAKVFAKMTFVTKGEKENVLDTLYYILDENLRVIQPIPVPDFSDQL